MILDLSKPIDIMKAQSYFKKLLDKSSRIELKEFRAKRTISQNSYLHACFGLMSQETGYTIEEMKTICKREFGSFMVYEKEGNKFLRSTADLDKSELSDFVDYIRSFSLEQLGLYIPTSEEYIQNQFEILKEIEYVK